MKSLSSVLVFTGVLFLFFSCTDSKKPAEFTLMTYNIYHGESNYNRGESNLNGVAEVINRYQPDFAALQEVDSMTLRTAEFNNGEKKNLVKELEKLTGMHGGFGKAIDYSEGGYGEGLLAEKSSDFKVINLPTPKGGEGRAMIYTTYEYAKGKKITFAATHLCHQFEENRMAQIKAINNFLLKLDHPAVLAGDLNFREGSAPYKVLEPHWTDSALEYGSPEFTIPADAPRSRIDYIWLSKNARWDITAAEVPRADHSDHLPVVIKVKLH
ncbi:endonuclease/exonuclease/phosphatase family protein [Sinomicrobium kalidii]|uniref:endonuclease/exonuclease/phosphatase family protein n=1 Tax=Sinomicrobium kalidii TaxID=2900738 RepID=UPI001E41BEB3|nr:endonuclease/exonuclease/phosphatase family protein [Sinomicrobium kalidii]UGU17500.1 endonuclease/exonuclease/phosphatase family protein [Sinomicrobium kalidii]